MHTIHLSKNLCFLVALTMAFKLSCTRNLNPLEPDNNSLTYIQYEQFFTSQLLEGDIEKIPVLFVDGFTTLYWIDSERTLYFCCPAPVPRIKFISTCLVSSQTQLDMHDTHGIFAGLQEYQAFPIILDSLFTIVNINPTGSAIISYAKESTPLILALDDTLTRDIFYEKIGTDDRLWDWLQLDDTNRDVCAVYFHNCSQEGTVEEVLDRSHGTWETKESYVRYFL